MTIATFMAEGHASCDELFTIAENLASAEDWSGVQTAFDAFVAEIETHFKREEDLLFPKLESRMGSGGGPTQVMRMEHEQMRGLIAGMKELVTAQDKDEVLGEAETLLILMQQHNMKEEQILYPMIDQMLAAETDAVMSELKKI